MKVYNKNNPNLQIQKKKGNCFNCGKTGHSAATCRMRGNFKNNNNNKGSTSNKANRWKSKRSLQQWCPRHI